MFGATVAIPLIIAPALCIGDDNVAKSQVLGTLLFVSGLVTLLQSTVGVRSVPSGSCQCRRGQVSTEGSGVRSVPRGQGSGQYRGIRSVPGCSTQGVCGQYGGQVSTGGVRVKEYPGVRSKSGAGSGQYLGGQVSTVGGVKEDSGVRSVPGGIQGGLRGQTCQYQGGIEVGGSGQYRDGPVGMAWGSGMTQGSGQC